MKFGELAGATDFAPKGRYRERVGAARRMLQEFAGSEEDAALIAKHLAGYDNLTTDELRRQYAALPGGRRAKKVRGSGIRILAPLASLSRSAVNRLGFDVGRHMWSSVKKHGSGTPLVEPPDDRGGRASHGMADTIRTMWIAKSYEGADGSRVFYRTQRELTREIADEVGEALPAYRPSLSTVGRYKPANVKRAKRPSDLCPVCEEARGLQVKIAKRYGVAERGAEDGEVRRHEAKELCARVAGAATEADDPDYANLMVLRKHMDLADTLKTECDNAIKFCPDAGKIVMVADWAGRVEVRSHRSDAHEYFHSQPLQMLGALVSMHRGGGERHTRYIHAYDLRPRVAKNAYRSTSALEQCIQEAMKMHRAGSGVPPKSVQIWMDTARHFRAKLLMYHLLWGTDIAKTVKVELRFFAEHHGKTALDASFRLAREWVSTHVDYAKVKSGLVTMRDAVAGAYSTGGAKRYQPIFLKPPSACAFRYGFRKLIVEETSAVHEMAVAGTAKKPEIAINASHGGARRIPIRWNYALPCDDDDDDSDCEDENPWSTPQQRPSYVDKIRKKFENFL